MKWNDLLLSTKNKPYFTEATLVRSTTKLSVLRNQFTNWVKIGKLWRLKKGLYTLPDDERRVGLSLQLASNIILAPSYLSLEYMMSKYGLIPERVKEITAITSHKTSKFTNGLACFSYRHIKQSAFKGFERKADEFGVPVIVATPEKALLDKIYFDTKGHITEQYLEENLRLQNTIILKNKIIKKLAGTFQSEKMLHAAKEIILYRQKEMLT